MLEKQKIFSYKLVLSDINKCANCKAEREREQVVVEPIDPCSACAVDTASVIAREGSSDHTGGAKREKVRCPKRGIAPACASKLIFNSLERK